MIKYLSNTIAVNVDLRVKVVPERAIYESVTVPAAFIDNKKLS